MEPIEPSVNEQENPLHQDDLIVIDKHGKGRAFDLQKEVPQTHGYEMAEKFQHS